jgi:uncharacterized NAD(P)/FAD-binding protein YdhS
LERTEDDGDIQVMSSRRVSDLHEEVVSFRRAKTEILVNLTNDNVVASTGKKERFAIKTDRAILLQLDILVRNGKKN